MLDKEKVKAQQMKATHSKITNVLSKLNMQWSLKEDGHCLHNDWISLARSVGLSESDIPQLQRWVMHNGKKAPIKKIVKLKSEI